MTDQKRRVTEVHPENKYCELPSFDVNILVFFTAIRSSAIQV